MKKDDLIRIIRAIVRQELKKELPIALAQFFQKLAIKNKENILDTPEFKDQKTIKEPDKNDDLENVDDSDNSDIKLKHQLKEMFDGNIPIPKTQKTPLPPKKFTKNPLLNEVLNNTLPFNSSEKMAMRTGGVSPSVMMEALNFTTGVGEMMNPSETQFPNKVPDMPGSNIVPSSNVTPSVPMSNLPDSISALDLKNSPALPDNIKGVLNRDYRTLMRAIDKKKNNK